MQTKKKAARSRQRTARTLKQFQSPFYAPAFDKSPLMFDGFAAMVKGRPGYLVAYGTKETDRKHCGDRALMFDARTVIGTERVIRNTDGRERCIVILRKSSQRIERIDLDMTRDAVDAAILKARA